MPQRQGNLATKAAFLLSLCKMFITLAVLMSLLSCEGHNSDNLFFKTDVPPHHLLPTGLSPGMAL